MGARVALSATFLATADPALPGASFSNSWYWMWDQGAEMKNPVVVIMRERSVFHDHCWSSVEDDVVVGVVEEEGLVLFRCSSAWHTRSPMPMDAAICIDVVRNAWAFIAVMDGCAAGNSSINGDDGGCS